MARRHPLDEVEDSYIVHYIFEIACGISFVSEPMLFNSLIDKRDDGNGKLECELHFFVCNRALASDEGAPAPPPYNQHNVVSLRYLVQTGLVRVRLGFYAKARKLGVENLEAEFFKESGQ